MSTNIPGAENLGRLIGDAELFCTASMEVHGNIVPSALIRYGDNGLVILSSRNLPFEMANNHFEELALQMCMCHNADAAVLVNEAWCKSTTKGKPLDSSRSTPIHEDREEAVAMLGQSRGRSLAMLLPIIRADDGSFLNIGDPLAIQTSCTLGHGSRLMSNELPSTKDQRRARLKLHFAGISPESGAFCRPIGGDAEKHHVISPHGFPLTHEAFESKELAEEFIPKFCVQMRQQGYYPAVGEAIPLEELPGRLVVVPESRLIEGMSKVMSQNQKREQCLRRQRGMQRGI